MRTRIPEIVQVLKTTAITAIVLVILFFTLNAAFPLREEPSWSPVVTDRQDNLLHTYLSNDDKWRLRTSIHEINPQLLKTILFKEDKYFYYHPGINPVAIVRAAFNNIIYGRKTSGASTITMQVARLLYPAERTYLNKTVEMFRALQLEYQYSKDDILCLYLNLVPYGGNVEGVKAASLLYFGVLPMHVNLSQAVILSIIPNRPGSLNPAKSSSKILMVRNKWLTRMLADGIINKTESDEALLEPIAMVRQPFSQKTPHLARRLKAQYSGETDIKTSIDASIQEKAEALCYRHHRKLSLKNIRNLSVMIIENSTYKVRAYIGSQDFSDNEYSGQVDGCDAVRSPGSTLKPMIYALAIDKGLITSESMLEDVPVNFAGYAPENFNSRCNGLVPASRALAYSLNIPAVTLLNTCGLSEFTGLLRKCGFSALHNDREMGLSVVLGGCGTRLSELGGMFAMLANGGVYKPLKYLENDTLDRQTRIVSDASAYLVTEMLTGMVRPDLPNNYENSLSVPRIAWKTGTSYGRRDAWSVGYNGKYTIAVWTGNFDGTGVPELTGADMATPLLFDLFHTIDRGSNERWFVPPRSLDIRQICSHSGLPPGDLCTDLVTGYFIPAVSDNRKCNHLQEIKVDPAGKYTYCMSCLPGHGYKKMMVEQLPVAVAAFYTVNNIEFSKSPPHNPDCSQLLTDTPPVITSPVNNKEYLLEKNMDQSLQLSCNATATTRTLYWYINDAFYASSGPGIPLFFTPEAGSYKISCSDDKGMNSNIHISVKMY